MYDIHDSPPIPTELPEIRVSSKSTGVERDREHYLRFIEKFTQA
jgi:hypothetical protein